MGNSTEHQLSDPLLDPVLDEVEHDTRADAGRAFFDVVTGFFDETRGGRGPVSTSRTPEELHARFDEPIPWEGAPLEHVAARLRDDVISDANHLYHPMYMGHQTAAPLPAAIWTEPVVAALNQSLAVWEMSPTATVIEHRVIRWMTELIGWDDRSGGTFTSGGTEATFTGLLAARNAAIPDAWRDGVGAHPPVVLCGEHAHYAVSRAVGELGLGLANLITIPSRDMRMDVNALASTVEQQRAAGRPILAVVATSGSTATGSFDDLETIGALCTSAGIWLHVDAAHGGSALLSEQRRHQLTGIRHARSIAWDPHKGMFMPLSAGMLLVRDARDLASAFAQRAPYLFHERDATRNWDLGVGSFQCSRRADVLKVWVAMQRYGAFGIGRVYDHLCDLTRALHTLILARDDFSAVHEPESNILCFRYTGRTARSASETDTLNRALRARFNKSGRGWITLTVLEGRPVLRVTLMNHRTRERHVRALLDGLAAEAEHLSA